MHMCAGNRRSQKSYLSSSQASFLDWGIFDMTQICTLNYIFNSWILTLTIHILLSTVLKKKWIGSKASKMYLKVSNKKWIIAFYGSLYFTSEDNFYVLDLTECELQVRKMFLGFIKKSVLRGLTLQRAGEITHLHTPLLTPHWASQVVCPLMR